MHAQEASPSSPPAQNLERVRGVAPLRVPGRKARPLANPPAHSMTHRRCDMLATNGATAEGLTRDPAAGSAPRGHPAHAADRPGSSGRVRFRHPSASPDGVACARITSTCFYPTLPLWASHSAGLQRARCDRPGHPAVAAEVRQRSGRRKAREDATDTCGKPSARSSWKRRQRAWPPGTEGRRRARRRGTSEAEKWRSARKT